MYKNILKGPRVDFVSLLLFRRETRTCPSMVKRLHATGNHAVSRKKQIVQGTAWFRDPTKCNRINVRRGSTGFDPPTPAPFSVPLLVPVLRRGHDQRVVWRRIVRPFRGLALHFGG